jgi:hypothetical protein
MTDMITREEYQKGQDRIHDRIDKMAESVLRQETIQRESAKTNENAIGRIEKSIDTLYRVMYGDNGKNGVITKLATMCSSVSTNRRLVYLILGCIVTTASAIGIKAVFK